MTKFDKEIQEGLYDPQKDKLYKVVDSFGKIIWTRAKSRREAQKTGKDNLKGKIVKVYAEGEKGYDPKKPATVYIITDSKGNKQKATYAEWLKWMKEQKKLYDPKRDYFAEMRELAKTRETGFMDINGKDSMVEIIKTQQGDWKAEVIQPINRRGEVEFFDKKPILSQFPKSLRGKGNVKRLYDPKTAWGTVVDSKKQLEAHLSYAKIRLQAGVKGDGSRLTPSEKESLRKDIERYKYRLAHKLYDPKTLSSPPMHWYEAMVKGIKSSSDVRNPYAIVKSIWSKLSPSKRLEIKRREAKGERFRYDLPLPVDKPTKGTGTVRMVKPFKLAEVQVNLSVKDYLTALKSGIFSRMKRQDGTTALVARCKSPEKNVNVFIDKSGAKS